MTNVLVTGGSGFIAGHVVLRLLEEGHRVRTTVRSLGKEKALRAVLADAGLADDSALSFVAADLTSDAGWAEAVAGCEYVIHVASPVHLQKVENEDDVIVPAREGTLRVLRAARDAGVRRVVLTSAFHAVGFGHPHTHGTFTEDDWSVLDGPGIDAYGKSKTLAERAAWDFVAAEGRGMELVAMLPVAVMGPVMGSAISGSNHVVQRILDGEMPGYPNMYMPIVDVRDVATAHVLAMTAPGAAGQRILVASGQSIALKDVGALLKSDLGDAAKRVPTRTLSDFVVKLAARFNPEFKSVAADLGFVKRVSTEKARALLGWEPRPAQDAVVAAGRSMVERSLVKAGRGAAV
ncbi:SDR family oxidoreductase [Lentzea sp. NPDC058436]|uniref:SDR family oxidoreductase n=1 Tax=Lentzea sp. NPDC058436 TaxID=3346499 RepID=UPI0036650AC8